MSRLISLFTLLALVVAAVSGRGDRFPTCLKLLETFGKEGVNLFTNAEKVWNIRSTECVTEGDRYAFNPSLVVNIVPIVYLIHSLSIADSVTSIS